MPPEDVQAHVRQVPATAGRYAWKEDSFVNPEQRPCWTSDSTLKKMEEKKSPAKFQNWWDRWNILGSKDNKQQPKSRRCYFDELPWTQVMDGKYVEHIERHGAMNFDVFCTCSAQERDHEFRTRFKNHQFPPAPAGTKAIADAPPGPEKVPVPGPHAVPIDLVTAAVAPKKQEEVKKVRGRRRSLQGRPNVLSSNLVWETQAALFKSGPFMDFFKWAHKRFGSLPRCWRMLDDDCNMRITRTEFLKMTRKHEFTGDARAVFKIMDRDGTDHVTFFHFDPVGALELAELQRWAKEKFGGIQAAFKALDQDRNGQLTKKEFVAAAKSHNMPNPHAAKTLFLILDTDNSHSLSQKEVSVIDLWRYPPWLTAVPDHDGAKAFKEYLLKKYSNNPIRAWRKALDKQSCMRVSWDAFEAYCRQSACMPKQHLPSIWRSLDDNMSGWLSLSEFWPQAAVLLKKFVSYCKQFYGSVYKAFIEIDDNGNGRLSHSEFNVVAVACKFDEAESEMLFAGLDMGSDGRVEAEEVTFLDKWYVERENKEEELWQNMANGLKQIAVRMRTEEGDD